MRTERPTTFTEKCLYAVMWLVMAIVWGAILAETAGRGPWGIQ